MAPRSSVVRFWFQTSNFCTSRLVKCYWKIQQLIRIGIETKTTNMPLTLNNKTSRGQQTPLFWVFASLRNDWYQHWTYLVIQCIYSPIWFRMANTITGWILSSINNYQKVGKYQILIHAAKIVNRQSVMIWIEIRKDNTRIWFNVRRHQHKDTHLRTS